MNNPFENIDARLSNIENLLLDLKHKAPQSTKNSENEELMTVQDAAAFLKLSVPTIYGLTQRAEIPVCKRGKRLYFSKQELSDWIKAGRKKTLIELEQEAETWSNPNRKRSNLKK
ncbi:MAG: DNA binding domain-containing protein [Bacteroidetes bacterium]|nr:MAG: DNA binding domain-containing protein [Bacteroidota bacterium]